MSIVRRMSAVVVLGSVSVFGCAAAVDHTPEESEKGSTDDSVKKTCVQTVMCMQGTHWSSTKCTCVLGTHKKVSCTYDSDCYIKADYCTSCACDALLMGENVPVCSGPSVSCFVDPCQGHTAACVAGTCTVQ